MKNIKLQIESWVANEAQATINSYYAAHLSSLTVPVLTIKFGHKGRRLTLSKMFATFVK
jgi:hypothetical protein